LRDHVLHRYTWDIAAKQTLGVYQAVLNGQKDNRLKQ